MQLLVLCFYYLIFKLEKSLTSGFKAIAVGKRGVIKIILGVSSILFITNSDALAILIKVLEARLAELI